MARNWSINALDPAQFGWLHEGELDFYLPSPERIREECSLIQAGWSRIERLRRGRGMPDDAVTEIADGSRVEVQLVSARRTLAEAKNFVFQTVRS
jgi:hypothetical protein